MLAIKYHIHRHQNERDLCIRAHFTSLHSGTGIKELAQREHAPSIGSLVVDEKKHGQVTG